MEDGWLFIQRIACGIGIYSLADSAETAACLKEEDLERIARQFPNCGLRDAFLLDAMLVRLACSKPCPDTTALLAQLCTLMGCSEADVRFLSRLAVILAKQDGKAYLDMGLELGERNWPGLEYIQKSAGILYTDQIAQAAKHGFHRVILHDCTVKANELKELVKDDLEMRECCLFRCQITYWQKIILTDTILNHSIINNRNWSCFQRDARVTLTRVKHRDSVVKFVTPFNYDSAWFQCNDTSPEGLKTICENV